MFVEGVDLGVKYKTSDSAAIARIANGDLSVDIQFANNATGFEFTSEDASSAPSWMALATDNTGAGNGASKPDWTNGWTNKFDYFYMFKISPLLGVFYFTFTCTSTKYLAFLNDGKHLPIHAHCLGCFGAG